MKEALWEIMEMEAPEKFYADGRDRAAFLLFPKSHWLSVEKGYSLYLNTVGLIKSFSTRKKALERLKEIIESANFPVRVYKVDKYGIKAGERIFFAENNVQKIPLKPKRCMKVFNIDEWE